MAGSAATSIIQCRGISTSAVALGKRNFRKFMVYGKRGTRLFKKTSYQQLDPEIQKEFDRGVRPIGVTVGKKFHVIKEMIPELIVPNLDGFKLKPYVSYRTPDVIQSEFGPQDLFYAVYSEKIAEDFKNGKLDENCNSLEPSDEEQLTAEEASKKALSIGADLLA
ncbi:large ribosomal subunit protein mL41-like [Scylla paramamosain]|uniref:large ribosomal subunit protein mL41-like n=1 Tax=Scylla paramamosain TaxID=85552 RepID=UPI003082DD70